VLPISNKEKRNRRKVLKREESVKEKRAEYIVNWLKPNKDAINDVE